MEDLNNFRTGDADPELARSPTMARFFRDVERWANHLRWVRKPLEIWWVMVTVLTGTWGGGLAAMFADQYIIAIGLFIATFAALAIRAISEAKNREKNILVVVVAIVFLAAHVLWALHTHKQVSAAKFRQVAEPHAGEAIDRKLAPQSNVPPIVLSTPTPLQSPRAVPSKPKRDGRRQRAIRDLHSQEP